MNKNLALKNPLCVALDLDDEKMAFQLARSLAPWVGAFKVGPRLIFNGASSLIQDLALLAPVFVDFKFFDIPSTMCSAVEAVFNKGASFVTVHALAGPVALGELAKLEEKLCQERAFKVLAVTVLTSFNRDNLPAGLRGKNPAELVEQLAGDVIQSGLKGLVCSPHELSQIRKMQSDIFIVTPGIRLPEGEARGSDPQDDQSRVMEPHRALKLGSNLLVVGRPVLTAQDPVGFCKSLVKSF